MFSTLFYKDRYTGESKRVSIISYQLFKVKMRDYERSQPIFTVANTINVEPGAEVSAHLYLSDRELYYTGKIQPRLSATEFIMDNIKYQHEITTIQLSH